MALIVKPAEIHNRDALDADLVQLWLTRMADEMNGQLDNANVKSGAAIAASKIAGTAATLAGSETLENKTLTAPVVASVYQDAGKTKLVTFPAATDTLVGRQTTDTLENKTLSTPVINTGDINTPDIDGGTIDDAAVSGGTIDGATIGGTTPGTGTFSDGAMYGQPLMFSKTIILPEYVQDETDFVPLLPVEAGAFPHGILITNCGIKLDANRAYSVVFEDWSDPATASADIATVATGAGEKEKESGALTTTVAAGNIVGVDLPTTTGAKFLMVWFIYEIKAS